MSKRELIILISAIGLSCLLTAGACLFVIKSYDVSSGSFSMPKILEIFKTDENKVASKASYHNLEKFVLSIKGKRQTHYVMLEMAIKTYHQDKIKAIDEYMPVIRNALLKLFHHKNYEQLYGENNVDTLQKEVHQTLIIAFGDDEITQYIDAVLFTKYVIQ